MEFSELNSRSSRAEVEVRQQMEKLESQLSPSAKQILEAYRTVRIVFAEDNLEVEFFHHQGHTIGRLTLLKN
jgi:hypothetical protein